MSSELVETGWKRFLERLKQFWGKSGKPRSSDVAAGAASTALAEGTGCTTAETPAQKPAAI